MHLNGDHRQVVIDSKLFGLLMSYAKEAAYELGPHDVAQVAAIQRHAIKFNRHVLNDIPLALQPAFILQCKQEYAKAIRQWAGRTGMLAYLSMTNDTVGDMYHFPVIIQGRSEVAPNGMRYVVVYPHNPNLEQRIALAQHRRITGGTIRSDTKIKLSHHPAHGPMILHASWMNDSGDVMAMAVHPSHLKLSPPEGSHVCQGGLLESIWRTPPPFSLIG